MSLFSALGIDHTFFIQFAVFALAFFTLTFGVYKPYAEAFQKREVRTTGSSDVTLEIVRKAQELRQRYESEARDISGQIKGIFEKHRQEAAVEADSLLTKARHEAQQKLEVTRSKVSNEIRAAEQEIKNEIPALSELVVRKLISKKG